MLPAENRRHPLDSRLLRLAQANSRVLNPGKDVKENVSQLWIIHATKREEQIDSVQAGDIVGVIGLRHSITGDTLCDPQEPDPAGNDPVSRDGDLRWPIEPESTAERKKLGEVLEMLKRQDPTFRASENEETGQTHHQRHGRAAPGSDQASAAARFQFERAGPQAARQLQGNRRTARPRSSASAIGRSAGKRCLPK